MVLYGYNRKKKLFSFRIQFYYLKCHFIINKFTTQNCQRINVHKVSVNSCGEFIDKCLKKKNIIL